MKRKPVLLAMLGLVLAFGLMAAGCSKKDTAQADNTASQEQIAAEVARQVAEQVAVAQAAAQAAAEAAVAVQTPAATQDEPPAPAATETPAPAPAEATPSAPKYAIGAEGPGGGIVFANSGGKYKEITKPENAGAMFDEPSAGWRMPTMPELMQVYNALRTKLNFGDYWYYSSSEINSAGRGEKYSRDHAMLSPAQTEYDRIREFFPDVQFILAAGGLGEFHFIRFTDGKIILAVNDGGWFANDGTGSYSVNINNDVKALYVREF
jgi:hypothetical protein